MAPARRSNPLTAAARRGGGPRPAGIAIPTRAPVVVSGDSSRGNVAVSGDSSRGKYAVSGDSSRGKTAVSGDSSYVALMRPDSWYAQQYALARARKRPAGQAEPSTGFPIVPVALAVGAGLLLYFTVKSPSKRRRR